jgi:hypothetical protein
MASRLSAEQVRHFNDRGYVIFREPVFSPAKFDALKDHFEEKLAALPADVRPELMDAVHFTDTKLFDWLLDDEVLDIVEPLLGPDIALFNSHFLCKPAGDGKRVPWHEDSYYWAKAIDPMKVVTIWLAIDPSNTGNGCMRVIPGTHVNGYSDYEQVDDMEGNVFHIEIKRHQLDESKAVDLVLSPNQASLHESHVMHGSLPNTSTSRRCGYTMRYVSTRSKFTVEAPHKHHLYLARGRDHAGNFYGDPNKVYEELRRYRERGH